MGTEEQARIIAENIRFYLDLYGYTQKDVADAIGVSHQRFSTWMTGKAVPRMDKVQALADFFHVPKSKTARTIADTPSSRWRLRRVSISGSLMPLWVMSRPGICHCPYTPILRPKRCGMRWQKC